MRLKQITSAALSACILMGSCPIPNAFAADTLLSGDADLSGEVDVSDAVLIARYYIGDRVKLTDDGLACADVNLDGNVDDQDVLRIVRFIAGFNVRLGAAEIHEEGNYNAVNLMEQFSAGTPAGKAADEAFISSQLNLTAGLLRYTSAMQQEQRNLLISPLSISQALAMTANGAKGQTLHEMEQLLGGKLDIGTLNQYYYGYTSNLPSTEKASFHMANSIWIRDNESAIQVPDAFLQTNADYYGAGAFRAPFDQSTVLDINNWVKFHTHDMIPVLIDSIDRNAVMFLINALAFEAEWANPYTDHSLGDGTFTCYDGNTITVPMMYSEEYEYLEDENAVGFIKKYAGGTYSFAAVLPKETVTVSDYIGMTDGQSLQKLLKSRCKKSVIAVMPKFKFAFSARLKSPLSQMGMPTAFTDSADFTGLNTYDIYKTHIDDVLHKTFIQVDERGTKAGAVTAVIMKNATAVAEPPIRIELNRPFIFMILDENTQLPVFIGYLMNPAANE